MTTNIQMAAEYVLRQAPVVPKVGIILGSGLGAFAEQIENPLVVPFEEIPHFPRSSVAGHAGKLFIGTLKGKNVVAMQGRVHYYEGHDPADVVFPTRVLKMLGVEVLIVTNAAGGVNTNFRPGDLMIVKDHINMMGFNPLRGKNDEKFGPRFPDMSFAYTPDLQKLALEVGASLSMQLRDGVYLALQGPSYETPAEIRMLRVLGADAVGMSTVPEVIAASQMGMRVLCISCITNMAAGILNQPLSHVEVLETTTRIQRDFVTLLTGVVERV